MNSSRKAAILFAAAGLLSASIYVWYAAWVDDLYKTMPQNPVYSTDPSASRGSFSDSAWYRSNLARTKYADRKWPILCLGFPIALTMALLLAKKIGWLQHVKASQALNGLPLYLVPGLIFLVSAISWYALFIPALAAAGWFLAMTVDKIKSKRSKAFRKFLISGGFCLALWVVVVLVNQNDIGGVTAWYVFLITLETTWAGIFGMELAADFSVRDQVYRSPNSRLQNKLS